MKPLAHHGSVADHARRPTAGNVDGVELVMAAEESFNITIADEEAENIRTAGALHTPLPRLVRSRPVNVVLTVIGVGSALVFGFGPWRMKWLAVLWPLAYALTLPLATHVPRTATTFGDVTGRLVSKNFARLTNERRVWKEADAWEALRGLIADQFGVEKEKVRRASGV